MMKTGGSQSVRYRGQRTCQSALARSIIARALPTDQLLDKRPRQLNRIEIRRVGWQVQQGATSLGYQLLDTSSFMNAGIVHNDYRTRCHFPQQLYQKPLKIVTVHRSQLALSADHSQAVKSTNHREVFAPFGGDLLNQIFSFFTPAVGQAKSKRDTHLIEKHQVIRVKCFYLLPESVSFFLVSLQSDFAFFLKLKRICLSTRVAVDIERLRSPCACHASASASAVQSFRDRTSSSKASNLSAGTRRFLPGVGFGCRLSPRRFLAASLSTLESETANLSAIEPWLAPLSRASIMRCRRSRESGLMSAGYLIRYAFDEDYSLFPGSTAKFSDSGQRIYWS